MVNKIPCELCGVKPGRVAQAPWPVPLSTSHCDTCAELESICYYVWELNTLKRKSDYPFPFLNKKDIEELPLDYLKLNWHDIQKYLFYVMQKKNKISNTITFIPISPKKENK